MVVGAQVVCGDGVDDGVGGVGVVGRLFCIAGPAYRQFCDM